MCREADEPGERRNVNKRFDPLHRALMRSGGNLFRNGWVDVAASAAGQTASFIRLAPSALPAATAQGAPCLYYLRAWAVEEPARLPGAFV